MRLRLKLVASALVASSIAFGQSLGDVARENREKQKAKSASSSAKPKVITNETLPASPDAGRSEAERITRPAQQEIPDNRQPAGQSAAQWKSSILQQKSVIAAQQAQIEAQRFDSFRAFKFVCQRTAIRRVPAKETTGGRPHAGTT